MSHDIERPKIGVCLIIKKDDCVLLGIRKSPFGRGAMCFPGGHLEMFERTEETARREVLEECGIEVGKIEFCGFTEDMYPEINKHYITICYIGDYQSGEPTVNEPDKIDNWQWIPIDSLKEYKDKLWKPCIEKFNNLGWI